MNLFAFSNLSVGISSLILSVLVFYFGKTTLHRALLFFNLVISVWGFGLFYVGIATSPTDALLGWKIAHFGGFLVGPVFYYLIMEFCQIQRSKLFWYVFLQAVFFILISLTTDLLINKTRFIYGLHYLEADSFYTLGVLFYLFIVLLSFYKLYVFLLKAKGHKRIQSLYITSGFTIGFVGSSFIFPPMYGIQLVYPFTNFGITIYCLILAYAILRHRLMDFHIVMRKSLVYSLSVGFLTAFYLILVLLMTRFISVVFGWSSFSITVLAALIIAFLFNPIKYASQLLIDRFYHQTTYDYPEIIKKISNDLLEKFELKPTCKLIVGTLFEGLKVASVYLLVEENGKFKTTCFKSVVGSSGSENNLPAPISKTSELVAILAERRETLMKSDLRQFCSKSQVKSIEEDLLSYEGKAVAPIFLDNELVFLLILGEKLSGDPFFVEDLNLLDTVANQSSISLKSAKLYADLNTTYEDLTREINARKEIAHELQFREEMYRTLVDSAPFTIMMLDRQGHCLTINEPGYNMMATTTADILNRPFGHLWAAEQHQIIDDAIHEVLKGKQDEFELVRVKNGTKQWWRIFFSPIYGQGKQVDKIIAINADITEEKLAAKEKEELQLQLQVAQKMEAIGRLAGGVAHDFNNLLSAIIGYSEMGLLSTREDEATKEKFQIIYDSGKRAASLTEQLLLFSRKQVLEMKDIDLNKVIVDMSKMIKRLIGEDISFQYRSAATVKVWGDKTKIEQVIMNLAVNARDSMPNGGEFLLQVSETDVHSRQFNGIKDVQPGPYLTLEAIDTGSGMSRETMKNIFEPFFTTKGLGKGTGLGLATVYGIIKQHKGYIFVDSEIEKGTTFTIYLPVTDKESSADEVEITSEHQGGDETILVVEDEPDVLRLIVDILQSVGYNVHGAARGEEAIQVYHEHKKKFDLLLTDVVMPGMNGRELAERLKDFDQKIKTIYMSGYTDDIISHHGVIDSGIILLNKPIHSAKLTETIRNVLDDNV